MIFYTSTCPETLDDTSYRISTARFASPDEQLHDAMIDVDPRWLEWDDVQYGGNQVLAKSYGA